MTQSPTCFRGFKGRQQLKWAQVAGAHHPLVLLHGGVLLDVTVAYETYG